VKCELVPPGSPRWESVLGRAAHDFYHLPAYARLSARIEGGDPVALVMSDARGDVLLPLIIRPIPGGGSDATSPYGYPGPLTAGCDDPAFLADALREGARFLAHEGLVSLFVRFHPILNEVPDGIHATVRHGDTVTVDLRLPGDEALRQVRPNHRVQIARARRAGHRVIIDAGEEHEAVFRQLYRKTMRRLAAHPSYLFDDRYFADLRGALGRHLHLVVVQIGAEVAAAGLFVDTRGIVQYHLSGSDERFRRDGPTKLMIAEVGRWARERGDRWLHLGGGLGFSDDALFHFKAGFSKSRRPFHTLRVVLQDAEYERLVRAADFDAVPKASAGFFPAYRRSTAPAGRSGTMPAGPDPGRAP
jgi:hypothetical protein